MMGSGPSHDGSAVAVQHQIKTLLFSLMQVAVSFSEGARREVHKRRGTALATASEETRCWETLADQYVLGLKLSSCIELASI